MISSEAMPFASTGGLADAVTSLSSALIDNGHNVKVLLPRYYGISRDILTLFDGQLCCTNEIEDIFVSVYMVRLLPLQSRKNLFKKILSFLFKVRVEGIENLEKAGQRALIIPNRMSYME